MTIVDAKDLAKYIISRCVEKECPTTNLRLQYYLYFSRIEYFRRYKKELCDTEMVCRECGPTSLDIYYNYTTFSGMPILLLYDNISIPENVKRIIDSVIQKYHDVQIHKLMEDCKKPGSPYDIALQENPLYPKITLDIIRDYIESEVILNMIESLKN